MPWYVYLLAAFAFCLLAAGATMFLPLRIFVHYLRENRNDHLSLAVKMAALSFRVVALRKGETEVSLVLRLGRFEFRVPVFRKEVSGQDMLAVKVLRRECRFPMPRSVINRETLDRGLALIRVTRPFLNKISWKRFDLEVIFGLEDAAVTGMAAGSAWAVGGVCVGLLYHFFKVDAAPQVRLIPRFNDTEMRLQWDGELAMPLFRWLKLFLVTRKVGGVFSGSPY